MIIEKKETFESLGLNPSTLKVISQKGFTQPSPIQEKIIPLILKESHDIIGIAQTGSGKTASFGLPLLEKLNTGKKLPTALIITPTRELALQVSCELSTLQANKKIRQETLYGGVPIQKNVKNIQKGIDLVVGTPGRLCDLIERKILDLKEVTSLVIDEADEMLKMGFIEDIKKILAHTSKEKRTFLFSATMPSPIQSLAQKYMNSPQIVKIERTQKEKPKITQQFIILKRSLRVKALIQILEEHQNFYGIIFCMTKREVKDISFMLKEAGHNNEVLHGDMKQQKREKVLKRFRAQKTQVLIATDIAARGLDIQDLTHVINHSLPKEEETYMHRIGRTGRAGKLGVALSFISQNQRFLIENLQNFTQDKLIQKYITIPNQKNNKTRNNHDFQGAMHFKQKKNKIDRV